MRKVRGKSLEERTRPLYALIRREVEASGKTQTYFKKQDYPHAKQLGKVFQGLGGMRQDVWEDTVLKLFPRLSSYGMPYHYATARGGDRVFILPTKAGILAYKRMHPSSQTWRFRENELEEGQSPTTEEVVEGSSDEEALPSVAPFRRRPSYEEGPRPMSIEVFVGFAEIVNDPALRELILLVSEHLADHGMSLHEAIRAYMAHVPTEEK